MPLKGIPFFFTAVPFLEYTNNNYEFKFISNFNYCLKKDTNTYLIIIRYDKFKNLREVDNSIKLLKKKYMKVIFFDDHDSSKIYYPEILNSVDKYLKCDVLKVEINYKKSVLSGKIHQDYYYNLIHQSNQEIIQLNTDNIYEVWNLIYGLYPVKVWRFRLGNVLGYIFNPRFAYNVIKLFHISKTKKRVEKDNKIFSVFTLHPNRYINYQRNWIVERYKDDKRFLMKNVGSKKYYKHLEKSALTVSPFGYGEICFRDYEAIMFKSALFKPSLEHLKNSNGMFIPFETYIPFKWDMSDFDELINYYFEHPKECERIATNAFNKFQSIRLDSSNMIDRLLPEIL